MDLTLSAPHPTPPVSCPAVHLDIAVRTDRGREREGNEDSFLVATPPGCAVLAVCDGMGGAAGGEVASATAVEVIREVMTRGAAPASVDALAFRLLHSVEEASRRVHAASLARPRLSGMGTTATACALRDDALFIAQVGDSRAYLYRGGCLTQLTRDQTLATELLERGQLAPEEVDTFPLGHVILQAVGTSARVEVDLRRVSLCDGDVLLVCSDGLHGAVSSEDLVAALAAAPTAEAACEALVALANDAGGPDNITAIVARATGAGLSPPAGPPAAEKAVLHQEEAPPAPLSSLEEEDTDPGAMDEPALLGGVIARLAAIFRRRRAAGV